MKECSEVLKRHVAQHGFMNAQKESSREYYYDKHNWSVVTKLSTSAKLKSLLLAPVVIPIAGLVMLLEITSRVFIYLTGAADNLLHTLADKSTLFSDGVIFIFHKSEVNRNHVWSAELKKELDDWEGDV